MNLQKFINNITYDGMLCKIDELGKIVIPIDYRIKGGDEEDTIVYLQKLGDCLLIYKCNELNLGTEKKIDKFGRISISIEMCKELNWNEKDNISIWNFDTVLILKKVEYKCIFCKKEQDLIEFKGRLLCKECNKELAKKENNTIREFNYKQWADKYYNEKTIKLTKYLKAYDIELLKKLNVVIEEKIYTQYEYDKIKQELGQYYEYYEYYEEDEDIQKELRKYKKTLEDKQVSFEEYNKLLECFDKIDEKL